MIKIQKAAIRREISALRRSVSKKNLNHFSQKIFSKVTKLINGKNISSIGIYSPINNEVDLVKYFKDFKKDAIEIALPVIDGQNLLFCRWQKETVLEKSEFGSLEPVNRDIAKKIEAIITPIIACDKNGNRIGYGHGYFDRFFAAKENRNILKIGVCYDFQILESVPGNVLDRKMDIIISEKRTINISKF